MDGLFSSDWKARETALTLISREAISHLLSQVPPSKGTPPNVEGSVKVPGESRGDVVQTLCLEVVGQCCGDSVLKVFLASLVRNYITWTLGRWSHDPKVRSHGLVVMLCFVCRTF